MSVADSAVGDHGAVSGQGAVGGRTRITPRALDRLVSTVAAEAFGSDPQKTSVTLTDMDGRLTLAVSTAVKLPSLARVGSDRDVIARTGGTVLERAQAAQSTIKSRVSELTGYTIERVTLRLTGADVLTDRRVK